MTAPATGPRVKPAPIGSPEVREGRAPAICGACGGHHGPVGALLACYQAALAVSRARVATLEAQIARDAEDTTRGRAAREAVSAYRQQGGRP